MINKDNYITILEVSKNKAIKFMNTYNISIRKSAGKQKNRKDDKLGDTKNKDEIMVIKGYNLYAFPIKK